MPIKRSLFPIFIVLIIFSSLSLTACADTSSELALAPMADMPGMVHEAPKRTQQAYQFAAANPELLKQIPCYCGCVNFGHTSNYTCYVSGLDANGLPTFDEHALGCLVCVDITQDVMTRLRQGEKVEDIQGYIDQAYSKYGPATRPLTESESGS